MKFCFLQVEALKCLARENLLRAAADGTLERALQEIKEIDGGRWVWNWISRKDTICQIGQIQAKCRFQSGLLKCAPDDRFFLVGRMLAKSISHI